MANLRHKPPTGDPTAGGAFVDGSGNVNYMPQEDARKAAGFGTFADKIGQYAPYGILAGMGYGALTGGTGSLGALVHGGTAGAGANSVATAGTDVTGGLTAGTATGDSMAGASKGILGKLGGWLGGSKDALGRQTGGLDPMELILGGLSLFGNNDPFQRHQSFSGAGVADPKQALQHSLQSIYDMEGEMKAPVPVQRRTQYADVAPVSVPGLGFQIGGALGQDPAIAGQIAQDPSMTPNVKQRTPQNG